MLWKPCDNIWRCKEWAKDWCRGLFMPIYNKGNVKECSNYRTINLLASKVLLKIIVSRTQLKYLSEINEEQSGFEKDKGTREQMVNIRIIMEKYTNSITSLYKCA